MKYRGKCKEMAENAALNNESLKVVRGWYYEPMWSKEEQHWWCINKTDNTIVDPSRFQFPTKGIKEFYREFDGKINCYICDKECLEKSMIFQGSYAVCNPQCCRELLGVH